MAVASLLLPQKKSRPPGISFTFLRAATSSTISKSTAERKQKVGNTHGFLDDVVLDQQLLQEEERALVLDLRTARHASNASHHE